MDEERGRDTGPLALAIGVVALGSAACLATSFAVRGPFGTINDIGNAAVGILSGWLAWRLRDQLPEPTRWIVGLAVAGAVLTVIGSSLVVSGRTSFLLAGFVSSLGFAGIGAWLIAYSRSADAASWPQRLRTLGTAAGALMTIGIVLVPGIVQGLDDAETAPAWVWVGFLGWLGTFAAYPAWAIWLGIVKTRTGGAAIPASGETRV